MVRRSSRIVQQTQPLFSWMICSLVSCTRISLSMFSSPNSFSMTAIFWPWASVSTRLSSVVLPEPRKPVRMVAGMRPWRSALSGGAGTREPADAGRRLWFKVADAVKPSPRGRARRAAALRLSFPLRNSPSAPARCPTLIPVAPSRAGATARGRRQADRRSLFQKLVEFVTPGPDSTRRADRDAGRRREPRTDRARVAHDARGRDPHGRHDRRRRDGRRAAHGPAGHRRRLRRAAAQRDRRPRTRAFRSTRAAARTSSAS